jgi:WD40 repeat protein
LDPRLCNDNQWLVACENQLGADKQSVVLRDLSTGKIVREYPASEKFDYCPATGTLLLLEQEDSKQFVRLVDVESGKLRHRWQVDRAPHPINAAVLSDDGKRVAVEYHAAPSRPGLVQVFNAETGAPEEAPVADFADQLKRTFESTSPDGRWAVPKDRGRIEIFDRQTGTQSIEGHAADRISDLVVSRDGGVAATLAGANIIQVWEIPSGRPLARYQVHPLRVHKAAFSPDGNHLVFVEEREKIVDPKKARSDRPPVLRVRDFRTGEVLHEFALPADADGGLAVSPVEQLAAITARKSILLIDLANGRLHNQWDVRGGRVGELTFAPDGGTLICDVSGKLQLWDVDSGVKLYELMERITPTTRVTFSRTGNLFLTFAQPNRADKTSILTIYETATGLPARTVVMPGSRSATDSFAPDDSKIVAVTKLVQMLLPVREAFSCTVWDIRTSDPIPTQYAPWRGRYICEATPDGDYVFTMNSLGGGRQPVTVWKTPSALRHGRRGKGDLTEKELARNWEKLHGDPGAALEAYFTLVDGGESTVAFLRKKLTPAKPIDGGKIKHLIAALDSDRFEEREAAEEELSALKPHVEAALRATLERPTSLEFRKRVEQILDRPADILIQNRKQIVGIRSIQVLEAIGTDSARASIEHLANGAAPHRQTVYAMRSLETFRANCGRFSTGRTDVPDSQFQFEGTDQ